MKAYLLLAAALIAPPLSAQQAPAGDIPAKFVPPTADHDYDKRVVMIPMRDGTKLYTVIVVAKGAKDAPIVLTRTPYNAAGRANRADSASMLSTLPLADEGFVKAGYIRVYQDIRGKYGSEGDYVVTRPPIGPLNPTKVDHTTDAYDTIDWLVNKANLPESNGRVGMIGSSYEGFTVAMALLNPHPALKVAAPESPMIDGWMGDDWYHYGAFRLANIGWIGSQTGYKGAGKAPPSGGWDDYDNFRKGSAGDWAKKVGYDQLPFWQRFVSHPSYDAYWQGQALDKLLAANPSDVPTLWEQGLWDQEDMYGAITAWEALKAKGKVGNNFLVMGPWRHSQVNRDGRSLGPFQWNGDTAAQFRDDMVVPFFDQYLKPGSPAANLSVAAIYNTGENRWDRFADWPLACEKGCATDLTPLYFQANGALGFDRPGQGADRYVSDPAKPVPHLPRPVNFDDGRWGDWLVSDQRHADGRPDVLTYSTAPLTKAVRVSGAPFANLLARTTGTDGDFVVKIIDVYPEEVASDTKMGGYQLPISLDIFRGRYRDSFAKPGAIPAGKVQRYRFRLPTVNHVFQPGHRIMVQVQSSLFPLYDRNPQTFVPNIFQAKPQDYRAATITIERGGANASSVDLPVVPVVQPQAGTR
ncbi:glutaryl-7-ACA acylase [Sphingomonas sp. Leaf412]|uniref:CocE/NonD family hydrolase n=1 Tax=Sphingomonas sp. Leaf412 TaxID=1736370 RepID=UPI00070123DB|nr:CocE/NonD family hydrolase [Sphingomonas sp. Leaf412]KQT32144.1 glutaryl-7-ACA acylase [Sphingomonas sp. Leaf412]